MSDTAPDRRSHRTLYLGTFLVCLSLLAFEILSVRTLSFVLGSGYIYFAIALAMLGLSAAASLMSLKAFQPSPAEQRQVLLVMCLILAATILASHWGAAMLKDEFNAVLGDAGRREGFDGVVTATIKSGFSGGIRLGALLSLPYFAFGIILTFLFSTTPREIYTRLYFSDLAGGALGCVISFFAMEKLAFSHALLVPVVLAAAGGVAYCWADTSRRFASLGTAAVLAMISAALSPTVRNNIEPAPNIHILAKDYRSENVVREPWHGWNSFSRVGAVYNRSFDSITPGFMALSNGEGRAVLFAYPGAEHRNRLADWNHLPSRMAVALGTPKDALVIFAGIGADMATIDAYTGGAANVTGVELNHTMVEGGLQLSDLNLQEFYDRPNINMVVDEGRAFLQRDAHKYDVILLSWSGATSAYYAGSIGSSTQFLFTKEGYEALHDHLKPDGYAVILQVNKVNAIAALRQIMEERGLGNVERAFAVVANAGDEQADWRLPWDNNTLIYKPDGLTARDLATLRSNLGDGARYIVYAPDTPPRSEYWPYADLLKAQDLGAALSEIGAAGDSRFSIATDDRPFYLDTFRSEKYLDTDFWRAALDGELEQAQDFFRATRVFFVGFVVVAALVLILGPMLFYRGAGIAVFGAPHLIFFSCLGAGFMFIEISLMHKLSLLFGNPGLSIAIVLAALILFTGLGSLLSDYSFRRGFSFRHTAAGVLVYVLLYLLFNDALIGAALGWSMVFKVPLALAVLAPAGLLMGQLFPQGLKLVSQQNVHLIPWAWAINGALGTVSAGLAPLIAQAAGFDVLIAAGALTYGVILLLPGYGLRATP